MSGNQTKVPNKHHHIRCLSVFCCLVGWYLVCSSWYLGSGIWYSILGLDIVFIFTEYYSVTSFIPWDFNFGSITYNTVFGIWTQKYIIHMVLVCRRREQVVVVLFQFIWYLLKVRRGRTWCEAQDKVLSCIFTSYLVIKIWCQIFCAILVIVRQWPEFSFHWSLR